MLQHKFANKEAQSSVPTPLLLSWLSIESSHWSNLVTSWGRILIVVKETQTKNFLSTDTASVLPFFHLYHTKCAYRTTYHLSLEKIFLCWDGIVAGLPHHRKCKTLGAALTFQRDFKNESGGSRSCLPYSGTFLSPFFVLLCIPSTPCYCPVVAAAGWISFAIESASLVEEKMLLRWMNDTHPNPIPSEARPTPPSNDVKGAFLK